jgi:hypothetical protein
MMNSELSKLEQKIEALIERSISRLMGIEIHPSVLAGQLARAMEDGIRYDASGKKIGPDQYALTFHPRDAEKFHEQVPNLHQELAAGLVEAARVDGLLFHADPRITLAADPTLAPREVRVIAWHSSSPLEFTQTMAKEPKTRPGKIPAGAFLVVGGTRHFALDRPVINIGRRLDNQLILEDPHVSRTHAQLRVRDDRFVLFDLGSTGGTKVNNRAVNQHILQPGDVITIANQRLVYGEDPGGPSDETPPYSPPFPPKPAGDQRTRTTDWE